MNKELIFVRCVNRVSVNDVIDTLVGDLNKHGVHGRANKSADPRVETDHVIVRFSYSDGFYTSGRNLGLHPKYVLDLVDVFESDLIDRYFPGSKRPPHSLVDTICLIEHEANHNAYIENDIRVTKDVFNKVYGGVGLLEIEKVVFNNPATIVLWKDGTKTVVKCQPGDLYSKETGLAMCIAKKCLGNEGNFNNVFRKWIPDYEEEKTPKKPTRPVVQIIAKSSIEKRIERLLNDFFDLEKEDKSNG